MQVLQFLLSFVCDHANSADLLKRRVFWKKGRVARLVDTQRSSKCSRNTRPNKRVRYLEIAVKGAMSSVTKVCNFADAENMASQVIATV